MDTSELKKLVYIVGFFAVIYFIPSQTEWFRNSILSGVDLLHEYAILHVLTCLVPALFIAGAINTLIKREAVLKYLGHETNKVVAYSVASVSGAVLAVCSCTILPLFAGISKRGAGLGPAVTFLFAGPAINVAAIFLTASVLGLKIGAARAFSAIFISILVGLSMAALFHDKRTKGGLVMGENKEAKMGKFKLAIFLLSMVLILVVNGLSIDTQMKWALMLSFAFITLLIAYAGFPAETRNEWLTETWSFAKMLLPLLFIGVFITGFIMPLLPEDLIISLVGKNSVEGNLIASIFGAFMYFSTLTEVPILQGLIAKGMNEGPALALLLAGPSLSLPSMLAISKVLGGKRTAVYVTLVIIYSATAGLIFGSL